MSTILVLTLPEHGHVNATLPLIAELTRRGERAIYYATDPFRAAIEATGAEYRSYGPADVFTPPAHRGGLYSVMAFVMELAERVLPGLVATVESDPPDLLLIDSMCVWGHLLQQRVKTRAAMMASVFVPDPAHVTLDDMMQLVYGRAPKDMLLPAVDALNTYVEVSRRIDRQFGTMSPNLVEFFAGQQPLNLVFTSRYFHLDGDRFDHRYEFIGPSLAPRTEQTSLTLPPGEDPLVFVSLGTIFNERPDFYAACFKVFASRRCRALISIGERMRPEDLGPAPANVMVQSRVPQLDVLARSSVFVTHGGMNSVNEALWHGVPLLVFPQHGDQHLVAARVVERGAGLALPPGPVDPALLAAHVDQLLQDTTFRNGAQKIAETFRASGGPARGADVLTAYLQRSA